MKNNKKMYDSAISDLLIGINNKYKSWNPSKTYKPDGMVLSISPGRKFDKVIHDNSVWGFVAKTDGIHKGIPYKFGDVFKAAGWRAPAKWARGNVFDGSSDWYSWTGPNYL
jgi:hypothetical protein